MVEPSDSEALRASGADPRAFVVIFERHFDAVNPVGCINSVRSLSAAGIRP